MDKFTSQQHALRTALTQVLGTEPKKFQLVITDEQRKQVGELMMGWLKQELWCIKPGTRAAANPPNYIVGRQPTCLIEAWTLPRQQNGAPRATGIAPAGEPSKFELIKQALAAGLITKEQAEAKTLELLSQ